MDQIIVEPLSRTAISLLFPLVKLVAPSVDLQAWRRFALSALDRRRGTLAGVLTARRISRHHFSGMVCYRRELTLLDGQIMQIRNLMAIDILDTKPIILALMHFLGSLAQSGGCLKLHILVPEDNVSLLILPGLIGALQQTVKIHHCLDIYASTERRTDIEAAMMSSDGLTFRHQ
ncbi:MAG: hypothetical protein B7Z78_02250 [Rhodospirillales bacterium 20-60-12]|nr:MAG: hypothetical protein B7Z78_02250 [Rhodospirillales bacterium 20-60-12]HQT66816.1 hypothetical protein [Acetobacteraceae bacterium]